MQGDSGEEAAKALAHELMRLSRYATLRAMHAMQQAAKDAAREGGEPRDPQAPGADGDVERPSYIIRAEYDDEAQRDAMASALRDQGVDAAPWDLEGEARRGLAIVTHDWSALASAAKVAARRAERPYTLESEAAGMQEAAESMSRGEARAPERSVSPERSRDLAR